MPIVEDPEVKLYVQGIVDRIVAVLPPQPYRFETNIVLHNSLNAFAAPGGFVFVHTGLIQHLSHESELEGVLAHEIAHVTQRHIAHRIERGGRISLAAMAGAILGVLAGGGGDVGGAVISCSMAAGQAAMLNYSRADESDADQFGISYLVTAGYNPAGLSGAFAKIQEMSWGRAGNIPDYLSTHPDITARLTTMASRIKSMSADVRDRKNDDTRFQRVRTLVWAHFGDPQQTAGFFAGQDKQNPMACLGRAILAARQNRVPDAEQDFAEAIRLAPNDALIMREAGIFNYNKGDVHKAGQYLERCLAQTPDDYMALFFYARLLDDAGNSHGDQERYRRILLHLPHDAEVHTYYGRSLGQSQQLFAGYLHLAYAALYSNDTMRARTWCDRARAQANTVADQEKLARFEDELQLRWKNR